MIGRDGAEAESSTPFLYEVRSKNLRGSVKVLEVPNLFGKSG